jgi:hypothetical protein
VVILEFVAPTSYQLYGSELATIAEAVTMVKSWFHGLRRRSSVNLPNAPCVDATIMTRSSRQHSLIGNRVSPLDGEYLIRQCQKDVSRLRKAGKLSRRTAIASCRSTAVNEVSYVLSTLTHTMSVYQRPSLYA